MLEAIATIGYTKKSLQDFVGRLKSARVDVVVDIRLQNTSQLAGFAKKDDLKFLLEQGFGIDYVHMLEFAPTQELLDEYHKSKDWDHYRAVYSELIKERGMVDLFAETAGKRGWKNPCVLCAEDKPDTCHRRLLAEAVAKEAGIQVRHL